MVTSIIPCNFHLPVFLIGFREMSVAAAAATVPKAAIYKNTYLTANEHEVRLSRQLPDMQTIT
jgi:hypothetical protein